MPPLWDVTTPAGVQIFDIQRARGGWRYPVCRGEQSDRIWTQEPHIPGRFHQFPLAVPTFSSVSRKPPARTIAAAAPSGREMLSRTLLAEARPGRRRCPAPQAGCLHRDRTGSLRFPPHAG